MQHWRKAAMKILPTGDEFLSNEFMNPKDINDMSG